MELQPLGPEESASYAVSACSSHVGPIKFLSCAPTNMQSMTRRRLSITEWTAKGYLDRNILFNRVSQRTRDDDDAAAAACVTPRGRTVYSRFCSVVDADIVLGADADGKGRW